MQKFIVSDICKRDKMIILKWTVWSRLLFDAQGSSKKSKVTFVRNSFILRCIHGTWVADGTLQNPMQSSLTFKHLFHSCAKTCIPA